jgi:hypothetical protein
MQSLWVWRTTEAVMTTTDEKLIALWHDPRTTVQLAQTLGMMQGQLTAHWRRLRGGGFLPTHRRNASDAPIGETGLDSDGRPKVKRDRLLERLKAAHPERVACA